MASASYTNVFKGYTLKTSWSSTPNVAGNYSDVTCTHYLICARTWALGVGSRTNSCTVNGEEKSFTSSSISTDGNETIKLGTTTHKVTHNSDGTKTVTASTTFNMKATIQGTYKGSITATGTMVLDDIPRGSVLGTISNFTLGNAINIPITKYSSSFTDTLVISLAGTTIKTISDISNGDDVSFTTAELTKIYGLLPSATTGSFTFKLTTKSGTTSIGTSSKTATGTIPASVKPTISSVTISEGNTSVVPSSWGVYVQNKSKLKFVVSAAAGSGSSVSSVKTTINGSTYTGSTITTNLMNVSGSLTATITVTDKRNRSTSTTKTITIVEYDIPYITSLTAIRCDSEGNALDNGTYAKVTLVAGVYSVGGKNTATYSIKYKKTTDDEYQTYTFDVTSSTINSSVILSGIETNSTYNIMGAITDYFTTLNENMNPPLMSVFRTMNFLAGGRGGAVGKMAELEDVWEVAFKSKLTGGLEPIFLEADTDLNDVRTPNFYTGQNISNFNYINCPLTSGTFYLEVMSCGADGQVKQRIVSCSKSEAVTYERFYYSSSWGEWVRVSDFGNALLWSGGYYMTAGHTVNLGEPISKQANGIVLVFSEFVDGAAMDQSFHCRFVPKKLVATHNGKAQCIQMSTSNLAFFCTKYLYVFDDKITGHDNNNLTGTGACGITYTNGRFVLRYVIGV